MLHSIMAVEHNRDFNKAAARVKKKPASFDAEWKKLYDKWHEGCREGYSVRDLRARVAGSLEHAPTYLEPQWSAPYFVRWRDDKPGGLMRYCFSIEEALAIPNGTIYHNDLEQTPWS